MVKGVSFLLGCSIMAFIQAVCSFVKHVDETNRSKSKIIIDLLGGGLSMTLIMELLIVLLYEV